MNGSSYEGYRSIFVAGQYVTVANFIIMVYAFDLKRRFVCSVSGRFYEQSIHEAPERITRLRDEVDTYILNSFFKNQGSSKSVGLFSKLNHNTDIGVKP